MIAPVAVRLVGVALEDDDEMVAYASFDGLALVIADQFIPNYLCKQCIELRVDCICINILTNALLFNHSVTFADKALQ